MRCDMTVPRVGELLEASYSVVSRRESAKDAPLGESGFLWYACVEAILSPTRSSGRTSTEIRRNAQVLAKRKHKISRNLPYSPSELKPDSTLSDDSLYSLSQSQANPIIQRNSMFKSIIRPPAPSPLLLRSKPLSTPHESVHKL